MSGVNGIPYLWDQVGNSSFNAIVTDWFRRNGYKGAVGNGFGEGEPGGARILTDPARRVYVQSQPSCCWALHMYGLLAFTGTAWDDLLTIMSRFAKETRHGILTFGLNEPQIARRTIPEQAIRHSMVSPRTESKVTFFMLEVK